MVYPFDLRECWRQVVDGRFDELGWWKTFKFFMRLVYLEFKYRKQLTSADTMSTYADFIFKDMDLYHKRIARKD